MLLSFAEAFRDALIPFLVIGTALLALMFAVLIVQRLIRAAAEARRAALTRTYQPLIDTALAADSPQALAAASNIPGRHRGIAAALVLARLRIVRGKEGERAAALAERLTLTRQWREELASRRWWHRADAAVALGLVRDKASVRDLIRLLDDEHEQVRAASIDALGQIRDTLAVPALLTRMGDPTRHERARLVQALRAYGEWAVDALIDHGKANRKDRAMVATILSFIGGTAAAETLLQWATEDTNETRAAAWSALALVGLDMRGFYHAVKALSTGVSEVRAAAAKALARSGRVEAAPHLAERLDDEWEVAANAARALARLGADGERELRARAERGPGLGQDLARQVLWEGGHR